MFTAFRIHKDVVVGWLETGLGGSDPGSMAFLLCDPGPEFSSWFLCL